MAKRRLWLRRRGDPRVAVATVVAAFAMLLVRPIGRATAWFKLRFVEGK